MGSASSTSNALHEACRQGDLEYIQKRLPTITYEEINQRGSDGNTPLHLACVNNHKNIVSLLLQDERDMCSRWKLNKKGLTAYESAQSNEIRKLFSRPSTSTTHRFCDENPMISLQPKPLETNTNTDITSFPIPDNWLRGHRNTTDAVDTAFMCSLSKAPFPLKKLLEIRTEREGQESFEMLVQTCLANQPIKREKVIREYDEYKRTNRVEPLLNIYTMDTPIYGILQMEANAFATLLFLHIDKLASRAYTGQTYRGTSMTQDDINAYRWAQTSENYLLETRIFQSTSKSKSVARMFSSTSSASDKYAVLLTYTFEEKCITAIDLNHVAYFPDEEEVLLFPFTLFKVKEISLDSVDGIFEIILTYVNHSSKSFLQSWRRLRNP